MANDRNELIQLWSSMAPTLLGIQTTEKAKDGTAWTQGPGGMVEGGKSQNSHRRQEGKAGRNGT